MWRKRLYMKTSSVPLSFYVMDNRNHKIETLRVTKKVENKIDVWYEYNQTTIARFSVDEIYEYRPLYHGIAPSYGMTILTKNRNNIKLTPGYLDEVLGELRGHGGILTKTHRAMDTLQDLIALASDAGFLIDKINPPQDGFFYIDKKLVSTIDFEYPSATEVREALQLLNKFSDYYTEFKDKLGYILHWEIMAAFSFAKKQYGSSDKLGALYLFNSSRAGKTILGFLALHIWNGTDNFVGAGGLHSEASYGRNISQNTFPVLFDEGDRVFTDTKSSLPDVFKNSVLYPYARGRYSPVTGRYENIPALSAPIITSNKHEPRSAALGARLKSLEFLLSKPRTSEEMKEFNKEFDPERMPGPLTKLNVIGAYTAHYMLDNPDLIGKDWEDVSKEIWESIYEYGGLNIPLWMKEYKAAGGLEEAWENEENDIYNMFRKLVLRNAKPEPEYDQDEKVKIPITTFDKIEDVLIYSKETWIEYFRPKTGKNKGKEFVEIDAGICKDMMKEFKMDISLKIIESNLNGKITVSKRMKVIRWEYKKFVELLGGVLPLK